MKKCLVVGLTSLVMVSLAGCGEREPQLSVDQQFQLELLEKQQAHEIAMAKMDKAPQIAQLEQQHLQQSTEFTYGEPSEPTESTYRSNDYDEDNHTSSGDTGYSGGDILLGAAAGAAAGYLAGNMLSNGYTEYSDNTGNKYYRDSAGKEISKNSYESYRKQNPTVTKISNATSKIKSKVGTAATTAKGKVLETSKRIANSNAVQSAKSTAKRGIQKASESKAGKYVSGKAKVASQKAKKAAKKVRTKYKSSSSSRRR